MINLSSELLRTRMFSAEGPDGAGKTTQIPLISAALKDRGLQVSVLKNPDTTPLGQFLRANVRALPPWVRNQLFIVDIKTTIARIENELQLEGDTTRRIFFWDRYIDSIYTSNREMSLSDANELTHGLPRPRRTYLLDIGVEHILAERTETLDHHSDPEWLDLKVKRYRELAKIEPERIMVIDARQPRHVVTQQIVDDILKLV